MAALPPRQHTLAGLIDQAHEARQEPPRPHMGVSTLGHHCDRWLWLSFRWAVVEPFKGRILRLFRRGQNEEEIVVADLRMAGLDVQYTGDHQKRVSFGAHVSGSLDGIVTGVPEAPTKKHVLEIKTHNAKSFADLTKHGVEKSKPMHWAQMQCYMYGTDIDRALYVAVCKDDDSIYTERVRLDKAKAEALIERGQRIATADGMPEPCIGAAPDWYQCKMCAAHSFCHGGEPTKQGNCRTCAHSTALPDSTWHCLRWDDTIPLESQRKGCDSHIPHPHLVPYPMRAGDNEWQAIIVIDGTDVPVGEGGYSGLEVISNPKACASGDRGIKLLRDRFDGRITS